MIIDFKQAVGSGFNPESAKKLLLIVGGETKSGKSAFAQTDPESFIYDFEAGCGYVDAKAMVLPGPQFKQKMSVPMHDAAHKALLDGTMAKTLGRPITRVVYDTWGSWYKMVNVYLTEQENQKRKEFNMRRKPGDYEKPILTALGDMGQAGWNDLNDYCLTPIWQLLDAGYGVTILAHTEDVTRKVNIAGKESDITEITFAISNACSRALRRRAQFSARVLKSFIMDGNNRLVPTVTMKFTSISPESQADERIMGERIPLGDINIPMHLGMLAFYQRYDERVASIRTSLQPKETPNATVNATVPTAASTIKSP